MRSRAASSNCNALRYCTCVLNAFKLAINSADGLSSASNNSPPSGTMGGGFIGLRALSMRLPMTCSRGVVTFSMMASISAEDSVLRTSSASTIG